MTIRTANVSLEARVDGAGDVLDHEHSSLPPVSERQSLQRYGPRRVEQIAHDRAVAQDGSALPGRGHVEVPVPDLRHGMRFGAEFDVEATHRNAVRGEPIYELLRRDRACDAVHAECRPLRRSLT